MTRELRTVPDKVLRTPCKPVKKVNVRVKSIAEDLVNFLYDHRTDDPFPCSLSAPQLGESIRVIAFYLNTSYRQKEGINVLINPELTKAGKFAILRETCLSIPGEAFGVRRAKRVKVKGLNIYGKFKSYKAANLLAQMLQHEIDHLDGKLIDETGRKIDG